MTHKFIPDFFYETAACCRKLHSLSFQTFQKNEPVGVMPTGFLLGPQYYLYYFFAFSFSFNQDVVCRLAENLDFSGQIKKAKNILSSPGGALSVSIEILPFIFPVMGLAFI